MKRIRVGDEVIVISGAHKGRVGSVLRVLPEEQRVVVSGVALGVKAVKPSAKNDGGLLTAERSLHVSKVALFDPEIKKGVKIKFMISDEKKIRVSKKTDWVFPMLTKVEKNV